eukprot:5021341-Amphidinium_carterae.1
MILSVQFEVSTSCDAMGKEQDMEHLATTSAGCRATKLISSHVQTFHEVCTYTTCEQPTTRPRTRWNAASVQQRTTCNEQAQRSKSTTIRADRY